MAENCKVDDCQQRELRYEIERLNVLLAEIASQCHNLPRSATADKIEKLARGAVTNGEFDAASNG